jgi:RNA polymerase sigma-32 factor
MTLAANFMPVPSTGTLEGYLNMVHQIPVLSREEEVDLFQRYQLNDDLDAARQLVLSNLRYVVYIARSYAGYGLPVEDLVQQGSVGLMKSVKRFDLEHKVRLISFAVHWIKAEIHEYILKNWRIVKVATTKAQRKLFYNLRKNKQRLGWLNKSEVETVAGDLGVRPEDVVEMENRLAGIDESFDLPVVESEEQVRSPSAWISHGNDENPELLIEREGIQLLQHDGLQRGLETLDERSRDIIQCRWLEDEKVGLKALAEKYGVSMERIRQIEFSTLGKLLPHVEVI